MKTKFSFISDVIFISFITFLLSLVLFNYFIPHPYSIVYSACISALATILFFYRADKRNKAERLKRAEQKECEEVISELNFCDRQEQNGVIEKALKNAGLEPERKRGMIFLKDKNAVIICRFGFSPVNKADIVRAYNAINKNQKAYILSGEYEQDVINFSNRFDGKVNLVNGQKIYKYLKENDAMPDYKYKCFSERKKKGSFKNLLDKKKSKTFFVFGLLFLLTSFISPLKTYYIVCGCLFLIYSLVLRLFGKDLNLNAVTADNI